MIQVPEVVRQKAFAVGAGLALPIRRRHEIFCSTAARVWRSAPGCGLPTGAEKSRWLAALEAPDRFKLVDPDGLLTEPEYDLGIIVREDPLDVVDNEPANAPDGWQRARVSTPPASGNGAGVIERVSTGADRIAA